MNKAEKANEGLTVNELAYSYALPGTLLFINGAPFSGKSTIAPLLAANIAGCVIQNMDILRLTEQDFDDKLPEAERNPVLQYGSCDSYQVVGDGQYSPENLIEGYRRYSKAVCRVLGYVIPRLEAQGAQNVLFEGVQLQPVIVKPYLKAVNKLIIITSSEERLDKNKAKLLDDGNAELEERYSTERLILIQKELLRQTGSMPPEAVLCVNNDNSYIETVAKIIYFLRRSGTIVPAYTED